MFLSSIARMALFRIFSFVIIAQMIVTPGLAQAFNDIQFEEVNDSHIQILVGKPNQGRLDAFHSAIDAVGGSPEVQMEYALYATRNITVMKLLSARKALKELVKDSHKAKAPAALKRLYEDKILEISEDISSLESSNLSDKQVLREHLALGLVAVTLQIVQYDNLLKFIRTDIWDQVWDKDAKEYQAQCMGQDAGIPDVCLTQKYADVKWDKEFYIQKYNLRKLDAELQGKRDGLISQYHILSTEDKKVPLYKRIYETLKKDFGFPNDKIVQTIDLKKTFALPTELEEAINKKIDALIVQAAIVKAIDPAIEKALEIALTNNTKALEKLTSPIHFKDDEAIFLYLAENEYIWDETKDYYDYMKGQINFDKGFVKAYSINIADKLRKEVIDDTVFKSAIVLAVGAGLLTFGAGAGVVGAGMGAFGTTLGTYTAYGVAVKAIWDYSEADRYKGYAENFFYGSKDMSSLAEVKSAVEIEKEAFRNMVICLVVAGAPKAVLNGITSGARVIVRGAKTFVRLHPEQWRMAENLMSQAKIRLLKFGKFGINLINRMSAGSKVAGAETRTFGDVLKNAGARLKLSKDQVIKLLQESPKTKDFFKMISNQESRRIYLADLASDLGITLVTEVAARRGEFFHEFEYVALNMIVTVALITVLDMKAVTRTGAASVKMFDPGLTAKQRWDAFYTPGKDLAITTAKITFATSAGVELYNHIKNPGEEEVSDRLSRIFWTTALFSLWLGISSNIRSQGVTKFINTKNRRVGREILARQGITNPAEQDIVAAALKSTWNNRQNEAVSFLNNVFGTASTTLLAKYAIQDKTKVAIPSDLEDVYVRITPSTNNASYLFDFL